MEPHTELSEYATAASADALVVPVRVESSDKAKIVAIASQTQSVSLAGADSILDTDFVATKGKSRVTPRLAFTGPGAAAAGSLEEDSPAEVVANTSSNIASVGALDSMPMDLPESEVASSHKKNSSRQRFIGLAVLGVGLIAAIILGIRLEANKSNNQNASVTSPSDRLQQQTLPLSTLNKQLGAAAAANTTDGVTVNGTLVLAPTVQPSDPIPGQLYYDQASHKIQYYDGTGFVPLQGGNVVTNNTYNSSNVTNNYANSTVNNYVTNVTNVTNSGATITGTPGTIAMFGAGGTTLADSLLSQNGNSLVTSASTILGSNASGLTITTPNIPNGPSGDVNLDVGSNTPTGTVISDDTFESGTDNYAQDPVDNPETLTQDCTVAHSGGCSLRLSTSTNFGREGAAQAEPFTTHAVAGHQYYFSAWFKGGNESDTFGAFVFFSKNQLNSPAGSGTYQWGQVTDVVNGWTQVTGAVTAPLGTNYMELSFLAYVGSGVTHYMDDVTITDMNDTVGSSVEIGTGNAQSITIGNNNELGLTTITSGSAGVSIQDTLGAISIKSTNNDDAITGNHIYLSGAGGTGNGVIVVPQADSTTAFQVQTADQSKTLVNVDTTDSAVSLGVGAGAALGNTRIGNGAATIYGVGALYGFKYTTLSAGTLTSLSINIAEDQGVAPNNKYQMAIYADNSGQPGAYLGSTAVGTLSGIWGTWNTLPLAGAVNVTANTTYWLTYWDNGGDNAISGLFGGHPSACDYISTVSTWQSGSDNGMPATFPSGSGGCGSLFSMYATYASNSPALTINSQGTLTHSGAAIFQDPSDSATAFQIQDSTGADLLTADTTTSTITITNLVVSANITIDGHIITGGTTPGIAAGAAACTAPTVNVVGNDTSGLITVTTGTGCSAAGVLATITFANTFDTAPHVVISPAAASTQGLGYVDASTILTTSFKLDIATTPASSTTYKWEYQTLQ